MVLPVLPEVVWHCFWFPGRTLGTSPPEIGEDLAILVRRLKKILITYLSRQMHSSYISKKNLAMTASTSYINSHDRVILACLFPWHSGTDAVFHLCKWNSFKKTLYLSNILIRFIGLLVYCCCYIIFHKHLWPISNYIYKTVVVTNVDYFIWSHFMILCNTTNQ